ncbi:MAG: phosphate transport system regulatory protein PhoU, partial [Bacteroidia bacterium]|nr:phosphate transport system regulatory protein PhoU [Bacteroidia bacterium]
MKVIEEEINGLKASISQMWALVHQQLYNAGEALLT